MRRGSDLAGWRATTTLLALTALAFGYLEIRIVQEGEKLIAPIAVILVLDALLALVMATLRRAWLVLPAVLLLVIGFVGDFAHQVSVFSHPEASERFVFAVIASVIQMAAVITGGRCAAEWLRISRTRRDLGAVI